MTMNFVVFESGSRAGLSAELFFEHYVDATGAKHRLFLSDLDEDFQHIVSRHPQVSLIHDRQAFEMLSAGEAVIFPPTNSLVSPILWLHKWHQNTAFLASSHITTKSST